MAAAEEFDRYKNRMCGARGTHPEIDGPSSLRWHQGHPNGADPTVARVDDPLPGGRGRAEIIVAVSGGGDVPIPSACQYLPVDAASSADSIIHRYAVSMIATGLAGDIPGLFLGDASNTNGMVEAPNLSGSRADIA